MIIATTYSDIQLQQLGEGDYDSRFDEDLDKWESE